MIVSLPEVSRQTEGIGQLADFDFLFLSQASDSLVRLWVKATLRLNV